MPRRRQPPGPDLFALADASRLEAAGYTRYPDPAAPGGFWWAAPDGTGRLSTAEALARLRRDSPGKETDRDDRL